MPGIGVRNPTTVVRNTNTYGTLRNDHTYGATINDKIKGSTLSVDHQF